MMAKGQLEVEEVVQVLQMAVRGMTAVDIAMEVDCNPETIRRILRGETHISVRVPGDEVLKRRHKRQGAGAEVPATPMQPFVPRRNLRERAEEEEAAEMQASIERMQKQLQALPTEEEKAVTEGLGLGPTLTDDQRPKGYLEVLEEVRGKAGMHPRVAQEQEEIAAEARRVLAAANGGKVG